MDIEKLIEQLNEYTQSYTVHDDPDLIDTLKNSATALSTLQAKNEKLRAEVEQERAHRIHAEQHADAFQKDCERLNAELERVTAELAQEREDFVDCVCSGVPNYAPYCRNRKLDCVDERGWCVQSMCHGFSRNKED